MLSSASLTLMTNGALTAITPPAGPLLDDLAYFLHEPIQLVTSDFVFPKPEHKPAARSKLTSLTFVPFAVVFDLFFPPTPVRLWSTKMSWAAVPKAAVDKDADSGAPENNIRFALE